MGCTCGKLKVPSMSKSMKGIMRRGKKNQREGDQEGDNSDVPAPNFSNRQHVDVPDRPKEFGNLPNQLSEIDLGINEAEGRDSFG